ncbi:M28 family peptidase [Paenibacillus sp. TAB 01]|uniref:M28 family peptidase n=1 Tax=Paenibacillus sp. TAB 01 TaxID=3368988 RepID=UPI0037535B26
MKFEDLQAQTAACLAEVDTARLLEYNREIAKEVRLSGSPEELRSFTYVKETLERFGLATNLMFCKAYISLPGEAQLRVNAESFRCITHSMAASTPEEGISAELVYVHKGIGEDYLHKDVKGKVALIDGLAVPGAVRLAQQQGAAGAVFINAGDYTHEMIVSPVWGNPTPETVNRLPQIPVVSVNAADGRSIKLALSESTDRAAEVWMKTATDTGWRDIPVLTADIPGTLEPDRFVLFSGHIDSWHYGAMDNGSANAVMVEVARILSAHRNQLRRSLRLAFWSGHSHGRYAGSAWYCDRHWEELHERCVLHVNIDSVGGQGATVLSQSNCMAETKVLATNAVGPYSEEPYEGARYARAGDQSFWGTGIPSLFMGLSEQPGLPDASASSFGGAKASGFGWWWHTTEDTLDKIDPDLLTRDCRIYLTTVLRACAAAIIPVDQTAAVQELAGFIRSYQAKAADKLDWERTLTRLATLEERVGEAARIAESKELHPGQIQLMNQWSQDMSRLLIPVNYVRGDIFDHDAALRQDAIPSLAEVSLLSETEAGSDEYYMLLTLLTRRLNRMNMHLKKANQLTEALLHSLRTHTRGELR